MKGVWEALLQAENPKDIVDRKVPGVDAMQAARDEVTAEVNRCARTPPKFSADGEWVCIAKLKAAGVKSEIIYQVLR